MSWDDINANCDVSSNIAIKAVLTIITVSKTKNNKVSDDYDDDDDDILFKLSKRNYTNLDSSYENIGILVSFALFW